MPTSSRKLSILAGFTIVELLVAITIFLVIVGVLVGVLVTSIRTQRYTLVSQKLLDQSSYITEYISRFLRMARKATTSACITAGWNYEPLPSQGTPPPDNFVANGIKFVNYKNECQEFYMSSGRLYQAITKNGGAREVTALASSTLNISALQFSVMGAADGAPAAKVTITMEILGTGTVPPPKINLQTTVSQRDIDVPIPTFIPPTPTVTPSPTPPITPSPIVTPHHPGLLGAYYAPPLQPEGVTPFFWRLDPHINFSWNENSQPASTEVIPDPMPPTFPVTYGIRWTGYINMSAADAGQYDFQISHDDGFRLFIDDMTNPIASVWISYPLTVTEVKNVSLSAGPHQVKIEYFNQTRFGTMSVAWKKSTGSSYVIVPPSTSSAVSGFYYPSSVPQMTTVSVTPSDDVRISAPNKQASRVYMKFNIVGIPANATITYAQLQLTPYNPNAPLPYNYGNTFQLYHIPDNQAWSENSSLSTLWGLATDTLQTLNNCYFHLIPDQFEHCALTDALRAAYNLGELHLGMRFEFLNQDSTPPTENGGPAETILVAGNYSTNPFSCFSCIAFYSKENGIATAPVLWVTYALPGP